jgi:hypothetical protein
VSGDGNAARVGLSIPGLLALASCNVALRYRNPLRIVPSRQPTIAVAAGYCCFGAADGLLAGAVVAPGVVFLVLVFVFFFGAAASAAGA